MTPQFNTTSVTQTATFKKLVSVLSNDDERKCGTEAAGSLRFPTSLTAQCDATNSQGKTDTTSPQGKSVSSLEFYL